MYIDRLNMARIAKDTVKHSKAQTQKGNTTDSVSKKQRKRGWCFTLNNYTEEEVKKIKKLSTLNTVEKLIFGKEVGKECGTPHLQGYIYWSYGKTFEDMKRLCNRWRLEAANGGYMSQTRYCTKDGLFFQKGMDKYLKALQEEEALFNGKNIKKWSIFDKLSVEELEDLNDTVADRIRELKMVDELYDDKAEEDLWSQLAAYGSDED